LKNQLDENTKPEKNNVCDATPKLNRWRNWVMRSKEDSIYVIGFDMCATLRRLYVLSRHGFS
jgi:hypothetical protein